MRAAIVAAALAAGVVLSAPPAARPARPAQVICYLGRDGQPGGCVTLPGRPAVPRFGRVAE